MVDLIKCVALLTFTRFVSGHGMVHGSPENEFAKVVSVPAHAVDAFLADELIERPKGYLTAAEIEVGEADVAPASAPAKTAKAKAAVPASEPASAADPAPAGDDDAAAADSGDSDDAAGSDQAPA